MGRATLAVFLVLAGCAAPLGEERDGCGARWLDASPVAATGVGVDEESLPIECIEQIQNRRLRLGFSLPAGPDCHVLKRVELVESADAVSIALIGTINDDPNAGACPDEARMVVTEIDLQAPVADRTLLDAGRP